MRLPERQIGGMTGILCWRLPESRTLDSVVENLVSVQPLGIWKLSEGNHEVHPSEGLRNRVGPVWIQRGHPLSTFHDHDPRQRPLIENEFGH